MRRIFIALLLTVIVYFPGCNREAFSRNPSLRFRLIGTWTTLFAEVIPKEVTYPKDRNPWVEIQFSSTLEITGDTVYIAVSSVNDSSRGVFTVACEYELASDTLTLLVTRYQNPPRIVREPYQISVAGDSLTLSGLPVEIHPRFFGVPAPGMPWWISKLYRFSVGSHTSGVFQRVR